MLMTYLRRYCLFNHIPSSFDSIKAKDKFCFNSHKDRLSKACWHLNLGKIMIKKACKIDLWWVLSFTIEYLNFCYSLSYLSNSHVAQEAPHQMTHHLLLISR